MHLCFILSKPAKPSIFKLVQLGEQAVYTKDSKSYGLLPVTVYNNLSSFVRSLQQFFESRLKFTTIGHRSLQEVVVETHNWSSKFTTTAGR